MNTIFKVWIYSKNHLNESYQTDQFKYFLYKNKNNNKIRQHHIYWSVFSRNK